MFVFHVLKRFLKFEVLIRKKMMGLRYAVGYRAENSPSHGPCKLIFLLTSSNERHRLDI